MPDSITDVKAILNHTIKNQSELNLSYMPFITEGGLFIPTEQAFSLGDAVTINLQLPDKAELMKIEGKVIWITPLNALHHALPGVGIQFTGEEAQRVRDQIEGTLGNVME